MAKIILAEAVNVVACDQGHCHIEFRNKDGEIFAEAVLDMDEALDIGLDILDIADDENEVPEGATVQ